MELPLAGVVGAAVGVAVGILDYGILASIIRRVIARQAEMVNPVKVGRVMKGLFVVNALVFGALGWWVGVSVAGIGVG
jgi:hypothetical protein